MPPPLSIRRRPKTDINARSFDLLFIFPCFLLTVISNTLAFSMPTMPSPKLSMGFDLGTSGARISVVDTSELTEVYTQAVSWDRATASSNQSYDDPDAWMRAIDTLIQGASKTVAMSSVQSLCFSGTSASCLMVDAATGRPTRQPCMYNYNVVTSAATEESTSCGQKVMDLLEQYAPPKHVASSATGSLAKLLAWNEERRTNALERLCHQADYMALQFSRSCSETASISSDWHNCLKLGYDVRTLQWPDWIRDLLQAVDIPVDALPAKVVSPGERMGTISDEIACKYGLPSACIIAGGTTDSNAAFFAATGSQPPMGTAVTSLGSTMAIKQLSSSYIEDSSMGVYSHRFPSALEDNVDEEAWLVGGASNVGCAVLRQLEFSNGELDRLSQDIDPLRDSPLQYYPLVGRGERFPIADSSKEPMLEPRPDNRRDFLHGVLQGIADVERDGFLALGRLGATPSQPTLVKTCGGGSRNEMWTEMRQRRLRQAFNDVRIDVTRAENTEASYGAAILAAASLRST